MSDNLLEAGFMNTVRTKAKNVGSKLANAAIASAAHAVGLSAPKSRGRLSIRLIADSFMKAWTRYLAAQRAGGNKLEGNANDLRNWIGRYFGSEVLNEIEPTISQVSGTQSPPPAGGAAPPDGTNPGGTPPSRPPSMPGTHEYTTTPPMPEPSGQPPVPPPNSPYFDQDYANSPIRPENLRTTQPTATDRWQAAASQDAQRGTFGTQQAPTTGGFGKYTGAPRPVMPPLETTANAPESPEERHRILSGWMGALQRTKPNSPERTVIIGKIKKLQDNPHAVARVPELANIKLPESKSSKGKLIEAKLQSSQINTIMLRLAAHEYETGYSIDTATAQDAQKRPVPFTRATNSVSSSFVNNSRTSPYMMEYITLANFDKATQARHKMPYEDIVAVRSELSKNGTMAVGNIINVLPHLNNQTKAVLFANATK